MIVDIWRRDWHHSFNLLLSLTQLNSPQAVSKTGRPLCTVNFMFRSLVSWELKEIRSYDGTVIVNRSIALHQPVIYVGINYR